jgi:hypothetical protein
MYFPATKVKVLASSDTKRGATLRKGSLGYVAKYGGLYTNVQTTSSKMAHYTMCPGYMLVTRFGNENKRRRELKPVVYVMPINKGLVKGKIIKNIPALLENAKLYTGHLTNVWKNQGVPVKHLPFVIAMPTSEEAVISSSDNELKAWVYSMFSSELLTSALIEGDNGSGAALTDLLLGYLPSKQELPWHKLFLYPKELYSFLDTVENKTAFVTFLQGQRTAYIRNYLNTGYCINGSPLEAGRAVYNNFCVDPNTDDIPGLYNLKRSRVTQKKLTLAWLDLCYKLNAHKGGLSYVPSIKQNINEWLDQII